MQPNVSVDKAKESSKEKDNRKDKKDKKSKEKDSKKNKESKDTNKQVEAPATPTSATTTTAAASTAESTIITQEQYQFFLSLFEKLLQKQNINGTLGSHKFSLLHRVMGHLTSDDVCTHVMQYLLGHGAQVNTENDEGKTPLFLAVYANKQKSVKFLLDKV